MLEDSFKNLCGDFKLYVIINEKETYKFYTWINIPSLYNNYLNKDKLKKSFEPSKV